MFRIFILLIFQHLALSQLTYTSNINYDVSTHGNMLTLFVTNRITTLIYLYKFSTTEVPAGTKFLNFYFTPIFRQTDIQKVAFSYIYMYVSDIQIQTDSPLDNNQLINNSNHVDFKSYIYDLPQLVSIDFQRLNQIPPIYYIYIAMVHVSIYSIAYQSFDFNIMINSSFTKPCPLNCNGGSCINGVCTQCTAGNYGHNCYLTPIVLGAGKSGIFILHTFNYTLFSIPAGLIQNGLNVDIIFTNFQVIQAVTSVLIVNQSKLQSCTLLYPYNCEGFFNFTAQNPTITLPIYNNNSQPVFIIVFNYYMLSSSVQFNIWKIGSNNNKLFIIIGSSCGVGIILVIIIIYLIRRSKARVIPKIDVKPLTKIQLDLYFPSVNYQNIEKQLYIDDKEDSIYVRNCVICIVDIKKDDLVRITYCSHIFHRQCLSNWFVKQLSCPYCRAPFDRKSLNDSLINLTQEHNTRNEIKKELKGIQLAQEILYRAKLIKQKKNLQLQKSIKDQNQKQLKQLNIQNHHNQHSRDQNSQIRIQVLN